MRAEEQHDAAAKVPAHLVLVEVLPVDVERLTLSANEADASESVRTNAEAPLPAKRNTDQDVAKCGQHTAVAKVRLAEEVRAVCEISLDAYHPRAHPSETRAPAQAARIDSVAELISGIAAEVPADERNEQAVGPCGAGGEAAEQRGHDERATGACGQTADNHDDGQCTPYAAARRACPTARNGTAWLAGWRTPTRQATGCRGRPPPERSCS